MIYIILLSCIAVALAGRLDNVYLPSRTSTAGGAGGPARTYQAPAVSGGLSRNEASILRLEQDISDDGFRYNYETSDGTKAEQQGSSSLGVRGSYSYVGPDGQTYTVSYVADQLGYRATGAHLPTPPPAPEHVLRSLARSKSDHSLGQYESSRSSYDADNFGYKY